MLIGIGEYAPYIARGEEGHKAQPAAQTGVASGAAAAVDAALTRINAAAGTAAAAAKAGTKAGSVAKKVNKAASKLVGKETSRKLTAAATKIGLPARIGGVKTWVLAVSAVLLGGTAFLLTRKRRSSGGAIATNPRRREPADSEELQEARRFRTAFHWGNEGRKVTRARISPLPRTAVKLGDLEAVVYRTRKKGEKATRFYHEFDSSMPTLAMDIRNKKLHIVGGGYTVTADGITG